MMEKLGAACLYIVLSAHLCFYVCLFECLLCCSMADREQGLGQPSA